MRSLLVSSGLALLLLTGCNSSSNNSNTSNVTSNSNNATSSNISSSNTSVAAKAKGDFSTPKAAVETFIAAATNRDADLLSQCFDPSSSMSEFRKIREKTASPKELDGLATFAQGGQVLDVEQQGDAALVRVKFKERNEKIELKKTADGWKIVDF